MLAQLFERNLHLETKGIGIKLGGLCLGVHGTWRTGGAGARVGAAGFVSRRKEPVSGATDKEGGGSLERPVRYRCSGTSFCCSGAQGPAGGWRVCSFLGVGYLGLFGLRLIKGSWSVQGCLLRRVGEEEAAGQERKMLDFRGVLLKEEKGF